jgi:hypothetical protein
MADGILPPRTQAFGLGEAGTRALYLPADNTVVELFAIPELLARAIHADSPPAIREETALCVIDIQRRLRVELRAGRVVALAWDSREAMPGSCAWSVLAKSAVTAREQFEQFAALCGASVSTLPDGAAQDATKPASEVQTQPETITPATGDVRVIHHLTKGRANVLKPLIDRAMQSANAPDDYLGGWTAFVAFAHAKVSPLLEYLLEDKDESVKYLDGGKVKTLTKRAFIKRVNPSAR